MLDGMDKKKRNKLIALIVISYFTMQAIVLIGLSVFYWFMLDRMMII